MNDKKKKPEEQLLDAFLQEAIAKAKEQAGAGAALADYLVRIVHEFGQLTTELTLQIDNCLSELGREMEGREPSEATEKAWELKGQASAFAFVAEQLSAMINRLEEHKNETIH